MKALVYIGNQRVEPRETDPPRPGPGEVLLRVKRAGICGTDLHIFQGHMDRRVKPPMVMGHEMCGEVAEVSQDAEASIGERVVVEPTVFCRRCPACRRGHTHVCQNLNFMGADSTGAFQEYWSVPQDRLHRIPDNLGDDVGALIEPLAVAIHDMRMAQVEVGDRAVVIGGGPIGLLVALAARLDGAEVVISEVNPYRIEMARAFGIQGINPNDDNLEAWVDDWTGGAGADLVFEVSGSPAGARVMTDLLRVRGKVILIAIHAEPPPVNLFQFFSRELSMIACRVYEPIDFERAIRIAASGVIDLKGMISKVIPLTEAAEGFEEMNRGGDVMKILLDCQA